MQSITQHKLNFIDFDKYYTKVNNLFDYIYIEVNNYIYLPELLNFSAFIVIHTF